MLANYISWSVQNLISDSAKKIFQDILILRGLEALSCFVKVENFKNTKYHDSCKTKNPKQNNPKQQQQKTPTKPNQTQNQTQNQTKIKQNKTPNPNQTKTPQLG